MYYIVDTITNETIRETETPFNVDKDVQPDFPLVQLEGVYSLETPSYNTLTHKLVVGFVDDYELFTRTFTYSVEPVEEQLVQARVRDINKKNERSILLSQLRSGKGTDKERILRIEKLIVKFLEGGL